MLQDLIRELVTLLDPSPNTLAVDKEAHGLVVHLDQPLSCGVPNVHVEAWLIFNLLFFIIKDIGDLKHSIPLAFPGTLYSIPFYGILDYNLFTISDEVQIDLFEQVAFVGLAKHVQIVLLADERKP